MPVFCVHTLTDGGAQADSGVPDDFIDALNDCSQDADCWAVRTKPERETNSEVCFVPSLLVALHSIYLYMYVYTRVCVRVCRCTLAIRFPVLFACVPMAPAYLCVSVWCALHA